MRTDVTASVREILQKLEVDNFGTIAMDDLKDSPVPEAVNTMLPGAKSVVILVMELLPEIVRLLSARAQTGQMNLRALYNRNIGIVNTRIDWEAYKLVKALHTLGFAGLPLPAEGAPFDNRFLKGTVSYHRIAEAAGMGVIGWHSMLLTPEFGPRVRLACIITNAPIARIGQAKQENVFCVKCGGACIKICPASAIKEPQGNEQFRVDKFACSAYLGAAGGCSECMKACPVGKGLY